MFCCENFAGFRFKKRPPFPETFSQLIFYPEHISHESGLSSEQAIAACCSSIAFALGSSTTDLSTVNLIASVAAFVLK